MAHPHADPKLSTLPKPQFWRYRDVQAYLNLSRTSIYKLIENDPTFPKPFPLTEKLMVWNRVEIEEFAASRREKGPARTVPKSRKDAA